MYSSNVTDGTSGSKPNKGKLTSVPLTKESTVYNMNFRDRRAYIFNQVNFKNNLDLDARPESTRMATMLANALIELDFNLVHIFTDLTYDEIKNKLITVSQDANLENCACILVVVMTHGTTRGIYANDTHYMPDELKTYFSPTKCPLLTGKPKLFIIQACRGDNEDCGIGVEYVGNTRTLVDGSSNSTYKLSTNADFLTAFATVQHFVAYRAPFIQVLTEELSKQEVKEGNIDFLSMLTIVQKRVSVEVDKEKQIPSVISTLTRKVFFKTREA